MYVPNTCLSPFAFLITNVHHPFPGIQAHVWTERIRTRSQLDEMLFPRLIAFAERAWHRALWEQSAQKPSSADWTTFANKLGQKELKRLENRGISYYLPLPGANKYVGPLRFFVYLLISCSWGCWPR